MYHKDEKTALESIEMAQWIAFAPFVFHSTLTMRDNGMLEYLQANRKSGVTLDEISGNTGIPPYGVRVLMEAALGIGLAYVDEEQKYYPTKVTHYILYDKMTIANMDFVNDVNYLGIAHLSEAIHTGKPAGLKELGSWATVYEGISRLTDKQKKSWFQFDHFYSDTAFPDALRTVYTSKPESLLDIGGNTGKWTLASLNHDPDVHITIVDLPQQIEMAKKRIEAEGFSGRVSFVGLNILDPGSTIPGKYDIIWMSQFLDCFSDDEITSILSRCKPNLAENGRVYILEAFWDRQKFKASAFCLQQTSLYFTAVANGNSQMYDSRVFIKAVEAAGYEVEQIIDEIGISHTLLIVKSK